MCPLDFKCVWRDVGALLQGRIWYLVNTKCEGLWAMVSVPMLITFTATFNLRLISPTGRPEHEQSLFLVSESLICLSHVDN